MMRQEITSMNAVYSNMRRGDWARWTLLAIGVIATAGCFSPAAQFELNMIAVHKRELESEATFSTQYQLQPIAEILEASFGTPDNPVLPPVPGIEDVLDLEKIKMAAGPYGSDENGKQRGLYRQHCVHCHGITGDGAGPTAAFLNPYPRDYRPGKFKFKSTASGQEPTHQDLNRIIRDGAAGTAMPSFKLLDSDEIEALTHYVKYLSIRGQTELYLIEAEFGELLPAVVKPASERNAEEQEYVESLTEEELEEEKAEFLEEVAFFESRENIVEEVVGPIVEKWMNAGDEVTEIAEKPEMEMKESIAKGRELFFSAKTGCAGCHGESALGDGQTAEADFYDDWTRFYYDPNDPSTLEGYLALGALEPRKLRPRNLRQGVFRGGRRPIDIFWRIRNGIEGAKMPAAPPIVTDEEIWHLVDFVRYGLPYDALSENEPHQPENVRVRN
ncbi:PbrT protein-putative c-type cytochrome-like protein [Blastopirellula marina DSM 3645]|uniref:PbrT protein-putative c-type cytochrome-like protein n=2 Tax=Blastopirellula marina TaxID=124 RepID=A3ZTF9_9BACT|nr:PbrT protein-putative c-type cytochrome-like protein [Blastopirellula marina DSM 3645]